MTDGITAVDVATFLAAFARAAAFLSAAPLLGSPNLPGRLRVAAAAAIALPVAAARPPVELDALAVAIPAEILLGLLCGFIARIVFAGAEAGGELIGLQFGLGMSAFFDPTAGEQTSTTRRLALAMAGLAFLSVGGMEASIRAVSAAPADAMTLGHALTSVIEQSREVMIVGVRFAAPALVAGLVANIGVALASRASPALNIFSVMLAAMFIIGGATLLATAPSFVREMTHLGERTSESIQRAVTP